MDHFHPFGGHLPPVQLMYRSTANFKETEIAMYGPIHIYCGRAGRYSSMPVHQLYRWELTSPMLDGQFPSISWLFASCTDLRSTANFKETNTTMYGPINVYCGTAERYSSTPVHQLYRWELTSPMLDGPFPSIWWPFASCTVDVQIYSQF